MDEFTYIVYTESIISHNGNLICLRLSLLAIKHISFKRNVYIIELSCVALEIHFLCIMQVFLYQYMFEFLQQQQIIKIISKKDVLTGRKCYCQATIKLRLIVECTNFCHLEICVLLIISSHMIMLTQCS